ncbi:MAG: nucleotidyltransferase family protein [Planctomycetota bacterium]
MTLANKLSSVELEAYRRAARSRTRRRGRELIARRERAWCAAREASRLVKDRFGATRVVVFGSLVHRGRFTWWSDVDLAAWGLRPRDTLRAMGAVGELEREIPINLVDVATCKSELRAAIERDGVDL